MAGRRYLRVTIPLKLFFTGCSILFFVMWVYISLHADSMMSVFWLCRSVLAHNLRWWNSLPCAMRFHSESLPMKSVQGLTPWAGVMAQWHSACLGKCKFMISIPGSRKTTAAKKGLSPCLGWDMWWYDTLASWQEREDYLEKSLNNPENCPVSILA